MRRSIDRARRDRYHEAPNPKTAPPATRAGGSRIGFSSRVDSDALHVRGVESLGARLDLELDFLSFGERLEAVHRDRRKVDEHVLAPFLLNEAVPLGVIEPLHFPSGHCELPPTE